MADIPLLGGAKVLYRKPGEGPKIEGQSGSEQRARKRASHAGLYTRRCSLCGQQFGLKGMPPAVKWKVLVVKDTQVQLYIHKDYCPVISE